MSAISGIKTSAGPGAFVVGYGRPYIKQVFLPQNFAQRLFFVQPFARQWFFIQDFALQAGVKTEF